MTPQLESDLNAAADTFIRAVATILRDHTDASIEDTALVLNTAMEATGLFQRAIAKHAKRSTPALSPLTQDAPHW